MTRAQSCEAFRAELCFCECRLCQVIKLRLIRRVGLGRGSALDSLRLARAFFLPFSVLRPSFWSFPFQDPRPVELDVGFVLFDQLDRFFVERRSADAYSGGRAEPVQNA